MPGKRFGHCAVLLPDNKYVLVTGGHNGDGYVQGLHPNRKICIILRLTAHITVLNGYKDTLTG